MNNFKQHRRGKGYTTMPNEVFMDKNLSLKAVGMLCKLFSLPSSWVFSEEGLTKITKDGKTSVKSALKELEEFKYLHRERIRDEKGRLRGITYHFYDSPFEPSVDENGNANYNPEVITEGYYDWMDE